MDPLLLGLVVGVATVVMLFSGIPIAFGLCFISVVFLVIAEGFSILNVFAETFYAGLNSFVLLSIPMFILMGMAVANSPAGKDLYTGLDRWLWRLPGGLVVSNIGACSIFAALSGSSPATCAAIGTMGIPENNITTVAIPTTKPNNKGSITQTPLIFLYARLIQIYMTLS